MLETIANSAIENNLSSKQIIGFSNFSEAYTNLIEGFDNDAVAPSRGGGRRSDRGRGRGQPGRGKGGRNSIMDNLHKARDAASKADDFKKQTNDSAILAGNSEGIASTAADNAAYSQQQSETSAENSCNSDYQTALQEWNANKMSIQVEWEKEHAANDRQLTKLDIAASDAILEGNEKKRLVNNETAFDNGQAVVTSDTLLNTRASQGAWDEIDIDTDKTLQNIEYKQTDLERKLTEREQAIINKYNKHKNNKPVQPNCKELSKKEWFTNYNTYALYEGYSNIEGFKEGASFTLDVTENSGDANYDQFKKSVHNLIDNKIIEKAVQEKNFRNDLVLSYISNDNNSNDLKKIYDNAAQKNNLNKRKNNILKYENNVFKQYIHILKVIVIVLLLIAPILILNKKEIINYTITKYLIIILFVLVFMYIIKVLYDINTRDSINFNKYKLDDGKYRKLQKEGKISRKGRMSDIFGGTCIGSACCDDGMTYDANSDKCIYTEIGAELTIISKIEPDGKFKIKSNKPGTLSLNSVSLSEPSISVGDNEMEINSYVVSSTTYTGTFTPDDGTAIVNIDIPKRPS